MISVLSGSIFIPICARSSVSLLTIFSRVFRLSCIDSEMARKPMSSTYDLGPTGRLDDVVIGLSMSFWSGSAAYRHARTGDTGDPCGTPMFIGEVLEIKSSSFIAAVLLDMNNFIHRHISRGKPISQVTLISLLWWTWSKKPLISTARKVEASFFFFAVWMLCRSEATAS